MNKSVYKSRRHTSCLRNEELRQLTRDSTLSITVAFKFCEQSWLPGDVAHGEEKAWHW